MKFSSIARRRLMRVNLAALATVLLVPLMMHGGNAGAMTGSNRTYTSPADGNGHNCRQQDEGSAGDPNDGSMYDADLAEGNNTGLWVNINDNESDGYATASTGGQSTGQMWANDRPIYTNPTLGTGYPTQWYTREVIDSGWRTGMQYIRQEDVGAGNPAAFRFALTIVRPDGGNHQESYLLYSRRLTDADQFHVDNFANRVQQMQQAHRNARVWGSLGATSFAIGITAASYLRFDTAVVIGACVPLIGALGGVSREWIAYTTAWASAVRSLDALRASGAADQWDEL